MVKPHHTGTLSSQSQADSKLKERSLCFCFLSQICSYRSVGLVAQWSEQATHNRLVAGSNPAGPTMLQRATVLCSCCANRRCPAGWSSYADRTSPGMTQPRLWV